MREYSTSFYCLVTAQREFLLKFDMNPEPCTLGSCAKALGRPRVIVATAAQRSRAPCNEIGGRRSPAMNQRATWARYAWFTGLGRLDRIPLQPPERAPAANFNEGQRPAGLIAWPGARAQQRWPTPAKGQSIQATRGQPFQHQTTDPATGREQLRQRLTQLLRLTWLRARVPLVGKDSEPSSPLVQRLGCPRNSEDGQPNRKVATLARVVRTLG